jgi:tetratricopeptide (TPR) repeat protein
LATPTQARAKAVANAPKASPSERLIVAAVEAGAKGNVPAQREALAKLVAAHPGDERAHNAMGLFLFGQQDYAAAIESFKKATAINAQFSQPYNMLGYSYRFLARYKDAEAAFKSYVTLIPADPNPHDSYAELLMKMGRHEESIRNYQKALAIDPHFLASYIGIGHNYMFMGRGDDARATFKQMAAAARNDGEKRQAMFWTAMSWVNDGAPHKALAELETMYAIAEINGDRAQMAGDLLVIGNVLLESGRADEALRRYTERQKVMDSAAVPPEVKEQTRRNTIFNEAKVAVAKNDLATARVKAAEYAREVAGKKNPGEVRLQHEIQGRIALAEKNWTAALADLKKANQQDPQVLYLQALAVAGSGDAVATKAAYDRVAKFNGLFPTYAYVRSKAKSALAKTA